MSLAQAVTHEFYPQVRGRGREYYLAGHVDVETGGKSYVLATVSGTTDYDVYLELRKYVLTAACTCPYFAGGDICKHIWAAILKADEKGWVQPADRSRRVRVMMDTSDHDDEDKYDLNVEALCDDGPSEETVERVFDLVQALPRARSFPPDLSAIMGQYRQAQRAGNRQWATPRPPGWKQVMRTLQSALEQHGWPADDAPPVKGDLLYVVDAPRTIEGHGLVLQVATQWHKQNGELTRPKPVKIQSAHISRFPDPADREILAILKGGREQNGYLYAEAYETSESHYRLAGEVLNILLPRLSATGRFHLRVEPKGDITPLRLDDGEAWDLWLDVRLDEAKRRYSVRGSLRRGCERRELSEPVMLIASGWVFWPDRVARVNHFDAFPWIALLRGQESLEAPLGKGEELLESILNCARVPRLDLPPELSYEEVSGKPQPLLNIRNPRSHSRRNRLWAKLMFDYEGVVIDRADSRTALFHSASRRLVLRDREAERAAEEKLTELGIGPLKYTHDTRSDLEFTARKLPRIVGELVREGWQVQAEGKLYRRPGDFKIEVSSGIDWFDLTAEVDYGGVKAQLPELLAALKRGENMVQLDDGTLGLLPEEWLAKYGVLARLGEAEDDHLRFEKCQAGLLDALLAAQPEATCDELFQQVRDELRSFKKIEPVEAGEGFTGTLRDYQRDGLGWLMFLQRFGFGGCLADDMGLGKTVQVLALLDLRREQRAARGGGEQEEKSGPSLIVVPRSIVFNWIKEAERFTPKLRVLDNTGPERTTDGETLNNYDMVLSTYGILRQDIMGLKDVAFDYVILDESQMIKNAATVSAKAARLLRAQHRLAVSGTPIENHLGELWSLFEFLNPGMLGSASVFRLLAGAKHGPDDETRGLLAHALRPFILRRTKSQVAKDLPAKQEETLYCELDGGERRLYDELRAHYRDSLLSRIKTEGMAKSKIQILEALLRLRQAACHPALLDKKMLGATSAKLECLLPQIKELLEEGHKALIFSQFTSMLAIVRQRIDRMHIDYEYLDGRTRNRQTHVDRFQTDPDCKLFLISLKAGGLGLNLTAAEYVFLLDPWWNPAVEAQAIDRTHRIGQTRSVFAYRLIARDTVEEKVLELQETKRALADSILSADSSVIRDLSREDLELLLS